jgi:hypothetical protein
MNILDSSAEPDLFAVACPTCSAALAVGDDIVGDLAACPVCDARFLVPEPEMPPPPPAARDSVAAEGSAGKADPAWREMATSLAESPAQPVERHRDMEFREPVRTLETEEGMIELRRLTDEEKRIRRTRRNVITLLVGTVILIVITLLLGREKPKKP